MHPPFGMNATSEMDKQRVKSLLWFNPYNVPLMYACNPISDNASTGGLSHTSMASIRFISIV